ncbi:MAG: type 1 glutamine amidotransferase [Planctomycetota bacterium]
MATIIVIQDGDDLGPGRLGITLRDHGYRLAICRVDRDGGDAIPADLDGAHGVLVMGSDVAPDADLPWIDRTLDLVRKAHDAELPVIGVCMGHQLIARALGGTLERMPEVALGFDRVDITVAGQTETMLAGVPWGVQQFQSHEYHVSQPPEGSTVLASGERCPVEAFRVGIRTYGFQYHFEFDRPAITAHVAARLAKMRERGMTLASLERDLDEHYAAFARAADRLCINIASFAFPFNRLLAV